MDISQLHLPMRHLVICETFTTYRFADYNEKVIDLLKRVTTVRVGTMEVASRMMIAER